MPTKQDDALCDWLLRQSQIFENMRQLSKNTGIEVAQVACATKEGYAWVSACLGTQCAVKPPQCENGRAPIVSTHTHNAPKEETAFSSADYLHTLHKGIQVHCIISPDGVKCERINQDVLKTKNEEERMRILAPLAEADTLANRVLKKQLAGKSYASEQEQYENKMYQFYKLASGSGLTQKCAFP